VSLIVIVVVVAVVVVVVVREGAGERIYFDEILVQCLSVCLSVWGGPESLGIFVSSP
jgi:hypothetical protein